MDSHSIRSSLEGQRDQEKETVLPSGCTDVRRRELRHALCHRPMLMWSLTGYWVITAEKMEEQFHKVVKVVSHSITGTDKGLPKNVRFRPNSHVLQDEALHASAASCWEKTDFFQKIISWLKLEKKWWLGLK